MMQSRLGYIAVLFATLLAMALGPALVSAQSEVEQADKYQWLEEANSGRSMVWVKAENARSEQALESNPIYDVLYPSALKAMESPSRLPSPNFHGGMIYNTWRDAVHVRGILRRATLKSFLSDRPEWQTVIDYDQLALREGKNWFSDWFGDSLTCRQNGNARCLVALHDGAEDAETLREFDLHTGKFIEGGFVLPRSLQDVTWVDENSLLAARDWGVGTMTKSGYPFVIKLWKRGVPLEQAQEVFRGLPSDVKVEPLAIQDGHGHSAILFIREIDTFANEVSLYTPEGAKVVALPSKAQIHGLLNSAIIVELNQDWKVEGQSKTLKQGSFVALDLDAVKRDPLHLQPTLIFEPTSKEFGQAVAVTRDHLILTTLDNVQGRAYIYTRHASNVWDAKRLSIPDNLAVSIQASDAMENQFFLGTTGFITPSALLFGDADKASLRVAKAMPAQFDASKLTVEQFEATAGDGTQIPYFIVHRKDIKYDSENPVMVEAYGGFQASQPPYYKGVMGKLWTERGGIYVLANIRGGGEFGPAWHEAGLKTHRQLIFDDLTSTAQDLFARKITSPRRIGFMGGSNGGLLAGVAFTQHPEMWNAIAIESPLLDMLHYERIAQGASWVGEYGSASVPEERAFLASISPYQQLKPGVRYPEPFLYTSTKDDRVGPAHARKFAAKLEELHQPFYYDESIEGGHSPGANLKEQAEFWAKLYTYFSIKLMN